MICPQRPGATELTFAKGRAKACGDINRRWETSLKKRMGKANINDT